MTPDRSVAVTLIGLISDTHNHLPESAIELLRPSDRILHAGDICEPRILWELETISPVTAVLGNNDYLDFGPSVNPIANIVIDGVRFVMTHRPTDLQGALIVSKDAHPDDGYPVVGVYGHKHVPHMQVGSSTDDFDLLISPGSVFRSREESGKRTIAKIEIDDGRILDAWIEALDGEVLERLDSH